MNAFAQQRLIPVDVLRKARAQSRVSHRVYAVITEEFHVSVFRAEPNLLSTRGKVKLHLAEHLLACVAGRNDFHTNFWSDGQTVSATIGLVAFLGNPNHIRHTNAVSGFNSALGNDPSFRKHLLQETADFHFKATVPGRSGTHNDLVITVRFDLVGKVLQGAVSADVSPGSHDGRVASQNGHRQQQIHTLSRNPCP